MADQALERTLDGRYVVVDGRRWRASDPGIPEALRQELVDELMAARRAVGAAKRADDPTSEAEARDRVQAAKVALGERGEPVGGETWRDDMDLARDVVRGLARAGAVEVLQRGEPVPAEADWKGPIRVRATGASGS